MENMTMDNVLIELFEFEVTAANQTYNVKFEINKNVKVVEGILFTADLEEMSYFRGRQRFELNGKEYLPSRYETKLVMTSINIPPSAKFYELNVVPGDGVIKVSYSDQDHPRAAFAPYKVALYVRSEI